MRKSILTTLLILALLCASTSVLAEGDYRDFPPVQFGFTYYGETYVPLDDHTITVSARPLLDTINLALPDGLSADDFSGMTVRFTLDEATYDASATVQTPATLEIVGPVILGICKAIDETGLEFQRIDGDQAVELLTITEDTVVDQLVAPGQGIVLTLDPETGILHAIQVGNG